MARGVVTTFLSCYAENCPSIQSYDEFLPQLGVLLHTKVEVLNIKKVETFIR